MCLFFSILAIKMLDKTAEKLCQKYQGKGYIYLKVAQDMKLKTMKSLKTKFLKILSKF